MINIDLHSLLSVFHFGGALIGSQNTLKRNLPTTEPIFDFPYQKSSVEFTKEQSYNILYNTTKKLLENYKDKRIAFPLSGGIDSTTMLFVVQEVNNKENLNLKITAYNQIFEERDESSFAKQIAEQTNTELKIIYQKTEDDLKVIDDVLKIFPEPILGNAHMYMLNRMIKEDKNELIINSLGGDECWGGYPNHRLFHENLFSKHIYTAQNLRAKIQRLLLTPVSKELLWLRYNMRFNPKTKFLNPNRYKIAIFGFEKKIREYMKNAQFLWNYYDYFTIDSTLPSRAKFNLWDANEHLTFLKCEKLYKYQINAMGELLGLKVLFPYLMPDYVKYTLALDKSDKIKDGISKWGMRQMMKEKLPKELLIRGAYGDKFGWGEQYKVLWENGYKDFVENQLTKVNVSEFNLLNWKWIERAFQKLEQRYRGAEVRVLISMAFMKKILTLQRRYNATP